VHDLVELFKNGSNAASDNDTNPTLPIVVIILIVIIGIKTMILPLPWSPVNRPIAMSNRISLLPNPQFCYASGYDWLHDYYWGVELPSFANLTIGCVGCPSFGSIGVWALIEQLNSVAVGRWLSKNPRKQLHVQLPPFILIALWSSGTMVEAQDLPFVPFLVLMMGPQPCGFNMTLSLHVSYHAKTPYPITQASFLTSLRSSVLNAFVNVPCMYGHTYLGYGLGLWVGGM